MKKKSYLWLLLLIFIFTFISCTNNNTNNNDNNPNEPIITHTHSYSIQEAKDATCTVAGNDAYYTCECGSLFDLNHNKIEKIPTKKALGHTYTKHQGLYAVISTDYISTYFTCDVCEAFFNEDKEEIEAMNSDIETRYQSYLLNIGKSNFIGRDVEILYNEDLKETVESLMASIDKMITDQVEDYKVINQAMLDLQYYEKIIERDCNNLEIFSMFFDYAEYYEWHSDCVDFYNNIETFQTEMSIKASKTKYRYDYFIGSTDEQIDAYIASLDPESNKVNNELSYEINKVYNAYIAGEIDEATQINKTKEIGNKLAKNYGYSNYLEMLFETSYYRQYSPNDLKDLKDSIIKYFVPLTSKYYKLFNGYYNNLDSGEKVIFNQLVYSEPYFYQVGLVESYLKQIGGTLYDNYNHITKNGYIYYNRNELENVTAFEAPGEESILCLTKPYSNARTFLHEMGHYNADRNGPFRDFDLCEIHSQGNEILFALYLDNNKDIIDNDIAKSALYFIMYIMLSSIIDGYMALEFENYIYNNDIIFTKATLDNYNKTFEKEYGYSLDYGYIVCVNLGYYISYATSAFSTLDLYLNALNDYDGAKSKYHKLYNCKDELTSLDYETVCNYAGLKTMLTKENVIAVGSAL